MDMGDVMLWKRYADLGSNRCASAEVTSDVSCCNGDRSSMIQKPRPYVPTTKSLKCSCTTMSYIGAGGRLFISGCHISPSLNVT